VSYREKVGRNDSLAVVSMGHWRADMSVRLYCFRNWQIPGRPNYTVEVWCLELVLFVVFPEEMRTHRQGVGVSTIEGFCYVLGEIRPFSELSDCVYWVECRLWLSGVGLAGVAVGVGLFERVQFCGEESSA